MKEAISSLSDTERKLLFLLTDGNATKKDAVDFLVYYDIDNETAVSTFLLNDVMAKFQLQGLDCPAISRIKGVANFYRFQNVTALMQLMANEPVLDVDLVLKLRFPDDIRPFTPLNVFLNKRRFRGVVGMIHANKVLKKLVPVKMQNKVYLIPEDIFLPDMVYAGLYRSLQYEHNRSNAVCYLYDLYRYFPDSRPSGELCFSIFIVEIRHILGRIKRWILNLMQ